MSDVPQEVLKNKIINMETENILTTPLIKIWGDLGFLAGDLNELQKRNMSHAYELAKLYILDNLKKYEPLSAIAFPVIYRIFIRIEERIELDIILSETINVIKVLDSQLLKIKDIMDNYGAIPQYDIEAELIAKFCDEYNFINNVKIKTNENE